MAIHIYIYTSILIYGCMDIAAYGVAEKSLIYGNDSQH